MSDRTCNQNIHHNPCIKKFYATSMSAYHQKLFGIWNTSNESDLQVSIPTKLLIYFTKQRQYFQPNINKNFFQLQ